MKEIARHTDELTKNGFTTISHLYSAEEIETIASAISRADTSKSTFRKSSDLYAIRQFLIEIPETVELIFNDRLKTVIKEIFGDGYFVVKSIYFDKPELSNWYVAYHQDLTISVDKKIDLAGYGPWTTKQNQFGVQPPIDVLKNIYTIRIHLDDTTKENGALKVIPGSHMNGIYRPEAIQHLAEKEVICDVPKGGIMVMKPLLLHSSARTVNRLKRRVIHMEFANQVLPSGLNWAERL